MALQKPSWVEAINEELNQFEKLKVWRSVELPVGKKALDTSWVFRIRQDDTGVIVQNKVRIVVSGFSQVGGLDYIEVYAQVIVLRSFGVSWYMLPTWGSRFIKWMSRRHLCMGK
ncbi:putative mitochondrial protein AtMg00820 [Bidens hawaiensis]|uniref:putative mitochondrial protein AtMg00820 n=1 Tax=Bidens hawaiensis TaxID=980011 RepID=UPI00404B1287